MTRRPYTRYPWTSLNVGDGFFVEGDVTRGNSLSTAAGLYSKAHPEFRFKVEKVEGGYRCTRIAA